MTAPTNPSEVQLQNIPAEREGETPRQAGQQLLQSLREAGISLAKIPYDALPKESQQHVDALGRDLSRALASVTRQLAENLERMAEQLAKRADEQRQ